jgi:hypothetical protein
LKIKTYEEEKLGKTKKNKKNKEKKEESLYCSWPCPLLLPFKIGWSQDAALEIDEVNWNWTV